MQVKPQTIRLYEDGTITIFPSGRRKGAFSELQKIERSEKMRFLAKKEKTFSLDFKQRRIINCAGIRQFRTKKNHSLKWFTLTFSKPITQANANKCLSKFIDNLKKTYYANSYVIVKENHKSGNPHFHCIVDMPFINFKILNAAWCNSINDFCPYSNNALTSGYKKTIENIEGALAYILKYIKKSKEGRHTTRIYFISDNILPQPRDISYNEYIYLTTKFESKTIIRDNFTVVFLKKFAFLPEIFELKFIKKQKKPQIIRKIPDEIQANFDF
jgi:hypothetical protein